MKIIRISQHMRPNFSYLESANHENMIKFIVSRYKNTNSNDWEFVSEEPAESLTKTLFKNKSNGMHVSVMSMRGQIFTANEVAPIAQSPVANPNENPNENEVQNETTPISDNATKYVCAYTPYSRDDAEYEEELDGHLDVAFSSNFHTSYLDEDIESALSAHEIYSNSETQFDVPRGKGRDIRLIIDSISNLIRFDSSFEELVSASS